MSSPPPIAEGPSSARRAGFWIATVLIWLASPLPIIAIMLLDAGLGSAIYRMRDGFFQGPFAQSSLKALTYSGYNWIRVALVLSALLFWLSSLSLTCRWLRQPESKRLDRWLAIIAVYVVTLGIVLSQTSWLMRMGAYWRVSFAATKFHVIAQDLFEEWPDQILDHPRLGTVGPHPSNANQIFLLARHGDSLDFWDDLGMGIWRDPDGKSLIIGLDSGLLGGGLNSVIVVKSQEAIPADELLRPVRIIWSRCRKIDSTAYFNSD